MSINNTPKPTGSVNNTPKVSDAETWATITTTWASETRTWAECAALLGNVNKPLVLGTPTTTSYRSPATVVNETGRDVYQWSNPSNATASDNSYATATGTSTSDWLKATDFGFTIPDGAVILGIQLRIERKSTGTSLDGSVEIVKDGSFSGNSKPNSTLWLSSDDIEDYGSTTELWGLNLSAEDVNSANFGFGLIAINYTGTMSVDHMSMAVTYAEYTSGSMNNTPKPS